ncbi:MAG: hypothetical protein ACREOE_04615 [Gemmatimonadales bacterium]
MLAIALLFAPNTTPKASAILYCGILANYECIYLSLSGNGSGAATFTSYTLAGTMHSVSLAACQRAGGTTSGTCAMGINYSGSGATSISFSIHVAVDSASCFSFQGGSCGAAHDVTGSVPIGMYGTDSDISFSLQQAETMNITLKGTGSGTITSSPRGINCPTDCSGEFGSGTVVTLTETPASGDVFGGYSTSCFGTGLGSDMCSWTITSTLDISATFTSPTPPPPTPSPTPQPTPTPHPTPTSHPSATPQPTTGARPTPRSSAPGAPTSAPTVAPTASAGVEPPPATEAPPQATDTAVPAPTESLVPLDTPDADAGQPASASDLSRPIVVGVLVVLLIALGGGAYLYRKPRKTG